MKSFVAVDIETANAKEWSICQLGLAIVENGTIKETVTELVQPPGNEYALWNTMIHGLKKEDTLHKPEFPEVWEKLKHKIDGLKLVVHNARFNIACLRETMKFYNMETVSFDYVCIYEMAQQKLRLACNSRGITFSKQHNAQHDAVACANIFLKLNAR